MSKVETNSDVLRVYADAVDKDRGYVTGLTIAMRLAAAERDALAARVETLTAELDEARNDVRVMSDHHRALERRADVAEARAETLENALRREWWFNHGCPIGSVYGDDGEMSCGSCATDFKRTPFEDLRQRVVANRTLRARAALASRPAGEEARPSSAEARVETLENVTEFMWAVVCNVSEGDWTKQTAEWQEAVLRAREQWHAYLEARPAGEETQG